MWQYHSVVKRKLKKAERGITKAVFTLTLWVTKQGLIISDKSTLVETCSKFISCQKTYGRCWKHLQPPMTGTACVPMASASATAWACLNPTEGGSISISQNKKQCCQLQRYLHKKVSLVCPFLPPHIRFMHNPSALVSHHYHLPNHLVVPATGWGTWHCTKSVWLISASPLHTLVGMNIFLHQ